MRVLMSAASWSLAAVVLIWGLGALWPIWFITDHLAGLAAQGLIFSVAALIACVLMRCFKQAGMAGVGLVLLLSVLMWSHRGPHAKASDGVERFPIKALVVNFYAYNTTAQAALAQVIEADADVLAWVETPNELLDRLRWDEALRERYPYFYLPDRARTGFPILISRWPLLTRQSGWEPQLNRVFEEGFLMGVVDHPEGQFALVWSSPRSPRHTERWAEGNQAVRQLAAGVNEWFSEGEARTMPIVVLGDQNATPTNWRSRYLRNEAGLRRAKPLRVLDGTYPANRSWPLRVAIDDALVSAGIVVASWQTLDAQGSDHVPVLMELGVPSGRWLAGMSPARVPEPEPTAEANP